MVYQTGPSIFTKRTLLVETPLKNGIHHLSTGAGFLEKPQYLTMKNGGTFGIYMDLWHEINMINHQQLAEMVIYPLVIEPSDGKSAFVMGKSSK